MKFAFISLIYLFVTITSAHPGAADRAEAGGETGEIAGLIAELGDPGFAVRERAKVELVKMGFPAVPHLKEAASGGGDPETRRAAQGLLAKIMDGMVREVKVIGRHDGFGTHLWVTRAAFHPDGIHLITAGLRGIYVWGLEAGRRVKGFNAGTGTWALGISPDGRRTVSGNRGGLRIHDWAEGRQLGEYPIHARQIWGAAFTAGGDQVVTVARDGKLVVWDVGKEEEVKSLDLGGAGRGLILLDGGKSALTIVSGDGDKEPGTVQLWDVGAGKRMRVFEGHTATPTSMSLSSDGRRMLTCSFDKTLRLWDFETGEEIRQFTGHTHDVEDAAILPGDRYALSCAGTKDPTVRLWDLETAAEMWRSAKQPDGLLQVEVAPDGSHFVTAGKDGSIRPLSLAPYLTGGDDGDEE